MTCNCRVCQFAAKVEAAKAAPWDEQRAMIDELYSDLAHAETEAEWGRAVIDGSWPEADQIIARARGVDSGGRIYPPEFPTMPTHIDTLDFAWSHGCLTGWRMAK